MPESRPRHRHTILIPLDGSRLAERVLRYLPDLGRPARGVFLLQVIGPGHAGILVRGDDAAAYRSVIEERRRAERYLQVIRRRIARAGIRSRGIVRTGDPVTEIVRCVRVERADLILMSTHGRRGLRRMVLGSVAENVLRRAGVPIFLVPARRRRAS